MPLIQIFISTHNRPNSAIKAIHSALNQNFNSFEVVVSDNSTNDETKNLVSQIINDRLVYKKRDPSLLAFDHFNVILKDVTSDFFVIFHDDDIMYSNMLNILFNGFDKQENIIAVGGNAMIVTNGENSNKKIFRSYKNNIVLTRPLDIVKQYSIRNGIVPFSSYMYKLEVAKRLNFDVTKAGKYSDVSFILELTYIGYVKFLAQPVMDYYIHKEQDSAAFSFDQMTKLIVYFCNNTGLNRKSKLIKKFRILNIYAVLKYDMINKSNYLFSKRYFRLIRFLIKSGHINSFIRACFFSLLIILKKAKIKFYK